jgi:hypothetical protein
MNFLSYQISPFLRHMVEYVDTPIYLLDGQSYYKIFNIDIFIDDRIPHHKALLSLVTNLPRSPWSQQTLCRQLTYCCCES